MTPRDLVVIRVATKVQPTDKRINIGSGKPGTSEYAMRTDARVDVRYTASITVSDSPRLDSVPGSLDKLLMAEKKGLGCSIRGRTPATMLNTIIGPAQK